MNLTILTDFLQHVGIKQAMLVMFMLISAVIVGYNSLYLTHSLHVTTHHMGLNAPSYIRTLLKTSIFVAIFTAGFSIFLLVVGWY